MTTPADDLALEEAFEASLAGRPVPCEAADLAAFTGAVRSTATQPGRPNAALAELLATGLLTDQTSPSVRTAGAAGSLPSRRARVRRRRFAMIFPALLAKLLSAGAVAQAATGAGVVLVVATGAGATGLLGEDVQDTITTVVGADTDGTTTQDPALPVDEPATDPGVVDGTEGDTTVVVDPVQEAFDPQAWIDNGPAGYESFGELVSESAHNDLLREWLRSKGMTFGSVVRGWAHEKGMDDADLVEEGVDLGELTEEPTTEPVTGGTDGADDGADDEADSTEVASTQGGSGKGNGGGNGGGNGNGRGHK